MSGSFSFELGRNRKRLTRLLVIGDVVQHWSVVFYVNWFVIQNVSDFLFLIVFAMQNKRVVFSDVLL